MSVRLFAGGALALLFSVSVFAQANERVLYVNAWNKETRAPMTGLGPSDFAVEEDGRRREILRVTPATSPMSVAILVDNTQASQNRVSETRNALTAFTKELQGIGPIAIIGVADRPTILADYSTNPKQIEDGIGKIFAMSGSGATMLDAIVEVSKGLTKREEDRISIVALTAENVEFSTRHYNDVLEELGKGGAMFHAVILNTPAGTRLNDETRNLASVMDRGPREHGGTRVDVLSSQAFEPKMKELALILKNQYRVVYARPQTLIPPSKIEVTATKAGVEANGSQARGQATK
ncbi:MAG TPA: hypothetical protein VF491_24840 [Vicinamibacterales bacterium]|jgi:hypothetical protein